MDKGPKKRIVGNGGCFSGVPLNHCTGLDVMFLFLFSERADKAYYFSHVFLSPPNSPSHTQNLWIPFRYTQTHLQLIVN